ncbi:MAG: hypothetical protein ACE5FO_05225 [Parvularculaceae bacterium]
MTLKPSLVTRIAVGKAFGLIFGLVGFFLMPVFGFDDLMLRFGVLFWYVTLGALVAIFGVLDFQPVLKFHIPWWACGTLTGAWMNFVLTLFVFDIFAPVMAAEPVMGFTSPWWIVLEGAVFGLIAGGLAERFGGEGASRAPARA